jgi:hypothetical protein
MLNGPHHIHFAFVDGKRVSRHAMKYCKTFLKLQEAAGNKQAKARSRAMRATQIIHLHQTSKQTMEQRKARTNQIKETTMKEGISHLKGTSQQ